MLLSAGTRTTKSLYNVHLPSGDAGLPAEVYAEIERFAAVRESRLLRELENVLDQGYALDDVCVCAYPLTGEQWVGVRDPVTREFVYAPEPRRD